MPIITIYRADFAREFPVPILYEDNHLLFALKAPGLLSQEDASGDPDILNILKAYLVETYHKPGQAWLGLVQRLDRMVGGIMVFAKTSKAASRLSEAMRNQEIQKYYHAIVHGVPAQNKESWENYLSKEKRAGRYYESAKGRLSKLDYELLSQRTLASGDEISLLRINLLTGRPHQIRLQCALHHLPVLGDRRYGLNTAADLNLPCPCLFASSLELIHPVKKTPLLLEAELPQSFPWSLFS